jgi:hypothetical protein
MVTLLLVLDEQHLLLVRQNSEYQAILGAGAIEQRNLDS